MGRPVQVLDLAKSAEYWDFDKAVGVCNILRSGARLGCMGRGRLPTFQRNAKDVAVYGDPGVSPNSHRAA